MSESSALAKIMSLSCALTKVCPFGIITFVPLWIIETTAFAGISTLTSVMILSSSVTTVLVMPSAVLVISLLSPVVLSVTMVVTEPSSFFTISVSVLGSSLTLPEEGRGARFLHAPERAA